MNIPKYVKNQINDWALTVAENYYYHQHTTTTFAVYDQGDAYILRDKAIPARLKKRLSEHYGIQTHIKQEYNIQCRRFEIKVMILSVDELQAGDEIKIVPNGGNPFHQAGEEGIIKLSKPNDMPLIHYYAYNRSRSYSIDYDIPEGHSWYTTRAYLCRIRTKRAVAKNKK